MSGQKLGEIKKAAENFIARRDLSKDKIALVTFSDEASVCVPFTQDASFLLSTIDTLVADGGTNFESAIQTSGDVLREYSGVRNILIFTDGANTVGNATNAKYIANSLRGQNVRIFAIATGDASRQFLASLTGSRKRIIWTYDGQFDLAFAQAETMMYKGLMDSGDASTFVGTLFRACLWTTFLCFGIAIFVKMMQNHLMQRIQVLFSRDVAVIAIGSLIVGAIAGGTGQLLFYLFDLFQLLSIIEKVLTGIVLGIAVVLGLAYLTLSKFDMRWALCGGAVIGVAGLWLFENFQLQLFVDRVLAWVLLGAILSWGLAWFIPNLHKIWAIYGGAIGGGLGATAFLCLTLWIGDIGGRLIGAFILGFCIGLFVGVVEQVCRSAYLRIIYSANEITTINLGEKPVSFGSGPTDTVYAKEMHTGGARFYLDNNRIVFEKNRQKQFVDAGWQQSVGGLTVEVCENRKYGLQTHTRAE
jgi:Ca-activated chloride channel family protein